MVDVSERQPAKPDENEAPVQLCWETSTKGRATSVVLLTCHLCKRCSATILEAFRDPNLSSQGLYKLLNLKLLSPSLPVGDQNSLAAGRQAVLYVGVGGRNWVGSSEVQTGYFSRLP